MKKDTTALQRELDQVQKAIDTLEVAVDSERDSSLGEGDPTMTRHQVDRALLERLRERAETLERAILDMGQGKYGICSQCGQPIHPDRLAVLPDTQVCVHCARAPQLA